MIEVHDCEQWRPVRGYEGFYEVSDFGRIRSSARQGTDGRVLRLKESRPCGYQRIRLYRDGRGEAKKVHRLVLEAFVGPCPTGMEACHNDGRRNNNRLTNLRWGTRKENCADARQHGTVARHERNGQAKLTIEKVGLIREMRQQGRSYQSIARAFGVSRDTARSAAVGDTWA